MVASERLSAGAAVSMPAYLFDAAGCALEERWSRRTYGAGWRSARCEGAAVGASSRAAGWWDVRFSDGSVMAVRRADLRVLRAPAGDGSKAKKTAAAPKRRQQRAGAVAHKRALSTRGGVAKKTAEATPAKKAPTAKKVPTAKKDKARPSKKATPTAERAKAPTKKATPKEEAKKTATGIPPPQQAVLAAANSAVAAAARALSLQQAMLAEANSAVAAAERALAAAKGHRDAVGANFTSRTRRNVTGK